MTDEELIIIKKEKEYIDLFSNASIDKYELFPINWYRYGNFKLKLQILDEAIKKRCLIVETKLYSENMMERVFSFGELLKNKINK